MEAPSDGLLIDNSLVRHDLDQFKYLRQLISDALLQLSANDPHAVFSTDIITYFKK